MGTPSINGAFSSAMFVWRVHQAISKVLRPGEEYQDGHRLHSLRCWRLTGAHGLRVEYLVEILRFHVISHETVCGVMVGSLVLKLGP